MFGKGGMQTILIADDEESLRLLIQTTLESPEIRILHAGDGNQALELARREHPQLLVLDWCMPGQDGIEVAEALRRDPVTADIAILMLTAMGSEQDRRQGLALGLEGYLIKPFSPLELIQCVQDVLSRSRRDRSSADDDIEQDRVHTRGATAS